ncbi:4-oxalocrotonate tautomerase [Pseudoduganella sp. FT93W]|uniref:4-oxalocrotonate tautomerase n=1 Tax=Duganella fentianensis TaxID=2692177 RepID=A0A845HVV8_9BURK|nr:4-oxalocrotonate tautomerase [Duganella fentianensis]MYN45159.1 4-oxalocrotonate tautomerase [Duganella fentianensis]
MPLTLIISEGVIPQDSAADTMSRLTAAFLELHGLAGNQAMTPNVIGHIQLVAEGHSYSGLEPARIAIVEWKVPSFAFAERNVQTAYVARATEIIHQASGRTHPKEQIWVNVVHAVDGAWGIAGKAYTNAELADAASHA